MSSWTRRRWLDFRQGHSIYLAFIMQFSNFILISYAFAVDKLLPLELWQFVALFIVGYFPLAIGVGRWHRKNQLKVDQDTLFHENVIGAKMWLFLLDILENKATEEQRAEMRVRLEKIAKK